MSRSTHEWGRSRVGVPSCPPPTSLTYPSKSQCRCPARHSLCDSSYLLLAAAFPVCISSYPLVAPSSSKLLHVNPQCSTHYSFATIITPAKPPSGLTRENKYIRDSSGANDHNNSPAFVSITLIPFSGHALFDRLCLLRYCGRCPEPRAAPTTSLILC